MMRRFLPFDYAIRNIARRPLRASFALLSNALVAALLVGTTAFVHAVESSHVATAPKRTAILLSSSSMRDLVRSNVGAAVGNLVAADVSDILRISGEPAVSSEIHMGSDVFIAGAHRQAFLRGVTERAFLVHEGVTLVEGRLPGPGEVLIGRLAAQKMELEQPLVLGDVVEIEGQKSKISGIFAAPGTTIESEIWVPLHELQGLVKRDDVSAVFVRTATDEGMAEIELFCARRLDLELLYLSAEDYYGELASYFEPITWLAWGMAILVGLAATTSAANSLYASVQDRTRELATLRAIGYGGASLAVCLVQEALAYACAGGVLGLVLARLFFAEATMSLAMTAFSIEVTAVSILTAFLGLLVLAFVGTLPALWRLLRMPVAAGLKAA